MARRGRRAASACIFMAIRKPTTPCHDDMQVSHGAGGALKGAGCADVRRKPTHRLHKPFHGFRPVPAGVRPDFERHALLDETQHGEILFDGLHHCLASEGLHVVGSAAEVDLQYFGK